MDADPKNWTDHGVAPKDMEKDNRYAAKWCRGIATNSLAVLTRLMAVIDYANRANSEKPPEDDEEAEEAVTSRAEEAATALLERARTKHGR
jgi:hypothetical protein